MRFGLPVAASTGGAAGGFASASGAVFFPEVAGVAFPLPAGLATGASPPTAGTSIGASPDFPAAAALVVLTAAGATTLVWLRVGLPTAPPRRRISSVTGPHAEDDRQAASPTTRNARRRRARRGMRSGLGILAGIFEFEIAEEKNKTGYFSHG